MGKFKIKKINPDTWYTLTELVSNNYFPWCGKGIRRYRRFIFADMQGQNYLKGLVLGQGRTTRYSFKGENIIKLYNAVEKGLIKF